MAINTNIAGNGKKIPICPMLSMGCEQYKICVQENCAWYSMSTKTCIANVFAHDAILNIKQKQGK